MFAATEWKRPEEVEIDDRQEYIVHTNGGEWRDPDLRLMPGLMVKHFLKPQIVRGRPMWLAAVNPPPAPKTA